MQLSVALQGIITQQLLPTADGAGRVAACEVLVATPAIRNLIREGKTHQIYSSLQTGGNIGMQTMDAALATLVREGSITQRAGRVALLDPRRAAPPARRASLRAARHERRTSSRRSTSAASRPRARSTPTPSSPSPTS